MRAIPILLMLVGLLLGGPALGQSGRGLVDHMTTASLPTCDAGLKGYQAYDTTRGEVVRCDGTGYRSTIGATGVIRICGDADTVNNNIVFYGPNLTLTANTNGFTCDIDAAGQAGALGGAEEIAQDAPVFANKAFNVKGMVCRQEADSGASILYQLRSDLAFLTPAVQCVIDGTGAKTEQNCVADTATTTTIAAGSTVVLQVYSTSNIGANNGFICEIYITFED